MSLGTTPDPFIADRTLNEKPIQEKTIKDGFSQNPIDEVDFVWVYRDSPAESNELKMSVDSVRKFCQKPHRIWIVGDIPQWAKDDDTINYLAIGGYKKRQFPQIDSYRSLLTAVRTVSSNVPVSAQYPISREASRIPRGIHKSFIWMMDDIFFLKDFDPEELMVPHANDVFDTKWIQFHRPTKNPYTMALHFSACLAKKELEGSAVYNFATHMPMPIYRPDFEFLHQEYGHYLTHSTTKIILWEILYGNLLLLRRAKQLPEHAPNVISIVTEPPHSLDELSINLNPYKMVSTMDKCYTEVFREYLAKILEIEGEDKDAPPKELTPFEKSQQREEEQHGNTIQTTPPPPKPNQWRTP